MAAFLFATQPLTRHVLPALPIVRELVARGHEVRWYAGEKFRPEVEGVGAAFMPYQAAYDYDDADLDEAFPARRRARALRQVRFDYMNLFVRQVARQHEDLSAMVAGWPADALVADPSLAAAFTIHELGGPPNAVFNVTCLGIRGRAIAPFGMALPPGRTPLGRLRNTVLSAMTPTVILRTISIEMAVQCRSLGARPRRFEYPLLSPYLFLQPGVAGFEYPRPDLPAQVHFVGALQAEPAGRFFYPPWWEEAKSRRRPLVLVTQGTVETDVRDLIRPTLKGLAGEDVLVVAAGVPDYELGRLEPLPDNARVERFIPFESLMPLVDVFVTNGGFGGVQQALGAGVPIVAAGATQDKPEVAGRVALSGAGINLKRIAPGPGLVARAVRRVLQDDHYRRRAGELAAELARHHGPAESATLLERLAATGKPVLRDRPPS